MKEQSNERVANFYSRFLDYSPRPLVEKFIPAHNFKFLNKLDIDRLYESDEFIVYKLLFNLGGLEKPIIDEDGKTIDYAQKVVNFLLEKIKKEQFELKDATTMFQDMEVHGFKRGFTDFFLKDFDRLTEEDYIHEGFISRCYNEFEAVQKTNTSNRGSQRQLKPTIEKFKQYFRQVGFKGVTPDSEKIANTIMPFFSSQRTFDQAVEIDEERKRKQTPDSLLSKPLSEKDVFAGIDDYANKIRELQVKTLSDLSKIAQNEFTFEWLQKNDPRNFILGKYCSCCAHLEGAGFGIMRASIVDPNV